MFTFLLLCALPQSPVAAAETVIAPTSIAIAPMRAATYRGAGTALTLIDSRLDSWGQQQLSGKGYDPATHGHEGVHMLNSAARNKIGGRVNAFYVGDGRCAIIKEPRTTISRAAQFVPEHLRGSRFNLYLVSQAGSWNAAPLYIFDEWSAYIADAAVSLSQASEGLSFSKNTDVARGQLEFLPYALAVVCAAEADDPEYMAGPDGEQLRRVVAWGAAKAQEQYHQCQEIEGMKWHCEVCLSHPAASKLKAAMDKCCGKSVVKKASLPQGGVGVKCELCPNGQCPPGNCPDCPICVAPVKLPQATIQPPRKPQVRYVPPPVAAADDCPTGT